MDNVFNVDESVADLPRLGVVLTLPAGLENLRWFGRGPLENYGDRQRTSLVDLCSDTVTGQYVPCVMLQEHGNRTDVRWLSLDDGQAGLRVRAASGGMLEFSASHYTAADLYAARHTSDLSPRLETILHLDYRQRGLGTGSCGPDPLGRYRIAPGRYAWSYVLEPAATRWTNPSPQPECTNPCAGCAGRILRSNGGEIIAFDDRVMALPSARYG